MRRDRARRGRHGTNQAHRTAARACRRRAREGDRVGDPGQLASVQAGGWLRAVGERDGAHAHTEVMRQLDPAERAALARLHAGDPAADLGWSENRQQITVHTGASGHAAALADWQAAVAAHGPARAVLIARRQEVRAALKDAVRASRRADGVLGVVYGTATIATGDRVICRRNDVGIGNGTRGTIRATHPRPCGAARKAGAHSGPVGLEAREGVELTRSLGERVDSGFARADGARWVRVNLRTGVA